MRQILWVWMPFMTLALVNIEWYSCLCCLEEERIGLLEIKAWINHPNGTSLPDWVDDDTGHLNCCKWHGVECNTTINRVTKLDLFRTREYLSLGDLYLNASLFLPFKELQSLDLYDNGLVGWFENQGFEVLVSKLRKLEVLDLSNNPFRDSRLSCLSGLSSLQTLDLSNTNLTGSTGISGFYNLTSLEELFLDSSLLPEDFLMRIGALSNLKVLSLRNSNLNGTLPGQGWCELKNLQQLHLSSNKLEGLLPACLRNLSSLLLLDVSDNQFIGNIAFTGLTNLTSLEYLDLSFNQFEVPVSFISFMNHSNLSFLLCDQNKLIAEPVFQSIIPKFQLKLFSLSNCTSKYQTEIPNFLHSQYELRLLDLSYNNFSGMIPSCFFENNTRLQELVLRDNFFTGPLQFLYLRNPKLLTIDIANNNIYGEAPRNICLAFPNLIRLNIANNRLIGGIPACVGNMSSLSFLDLSNNQLSRLNLEQLTSSLQILKLSNNKFDGRIPTWIFNSSTLKYLYINGNNLCGQLWDISPIKGLNLAALVISDNHFSGMLPRWIGNMSYLPVIDLSNNHFEGSIPRDFCNLRSVGYLDLSGNNLSGALPSCQPQIAHLHLSGNQLSGPLTSFFDISSLVALDVTNNFFTGPIPNWIGNISTLSVLVLKANLFAGELPIQLCKLKQLSILDVSKNKLSGPLPSCFGNLTFKAADVKAFTDPGYSISEDQVFDESDFLAMHLPDKSEFAILGVQRLFLSLYYEDKSTRETIYEGFEFTTKRNSYLYKGDILDLMSGMDLSCNTFSGDIPPELGKLDGLRALNLSHNNFTGPLPATLSKLNQIESLDLSYNSLTGIIPPQLTEITTLAVFSVAYNNLSGKTPERKNQFGTFDESSYDGNPLLCGPPLQNNCSEEASPSQPLPNDDEEEEDDSIDMNVFYVSFVVCYIIVVLAIGAVLYINPYWRRRWFYFIEECINTCYYFMEDSFRKLSSFQRS